MEYTEYGKMPIPRNIPIFRIVNEKLILVMEKNGRIQNSLQKLPNDTSITELRLFFLVLFSFQSWHIEKNDNIIILCDFFLQTKAEGSSINLNEELSRTLTTSC